jgi:hypothetical protein
LLMNGAVKLGNVYECEAKQRKGKQYLRRVSKSGSVAEFMMLTVDNLSENTSHDLARASLGVVTDKVDTLGSGEGSDDLANLQSQLLFKTFGFLDIRLKSNEGVDALTSQVIMTTNNGSFSNRVVKNQSRLDFRGRETMAGNVDHI